VAGAIAGVPGAVEALRAFIFGVARSIATTSALVAASIVSDDSASCIGVWPSLFLRFNSAPRAINKEIISFWPTDAA
jgi:hypothetical protein